MAFRIFMTAEPTNPYAPSATVAADDAREAQRRPSRLLAVAASVLAYPLVPGAGLYVLGRGRRVAGWVAAAVVACAAMVVAVRAVQPRLFIVSVAVIAVTIVAALADTIVARPGASPPRMGRALLGALLLIAASKGSAFAVKIWMMEAFSIPSGAMMPTLLVGDHVMVSKGRGEVGRGDVVVFLYPLDHSTLYLKRVLAMAGDTIEGRAGAIYVNGAALPATPLPDPCTPTDNGPPGAAPDACTLLRETAGSRSYTIMHNRDYAARDFQPVTVPAGHLFVMGDNRDNSSDSRIWGTVPLADVEGVASFVYFSSDGAAGVRWSRVGHIVQ
jgi:signal peptidase I